MPKANKKEKAATIQATSDYIIQILDSEPWAERLKESAYCASCPARQGGILDGDTIDHLCSYCPLRPYMMALADLTLRQRRKGRP